MWYVIVTISTVGYGDLYPVTKDGRIVGALIIVIGVGIFGTFTGYLANLFLSPPKESTAAEPVPAPDDVRLKLGQLKAMMAQQQAAMDEIDRLLESEPDPNRA